MNEEQVIALFGDWNDALATGDPDVVTAMYAEDAVLLPTVSNQVRHNHAEIRDYFVAFLAKQPQGVRSRMHGCYLTRWRPTLGSTSLPLAMVQP